MCVSQAEWNLKKKIIIFEIANLRGISIYLNNTILGISSWLSVINPRLLHVSGNFRALRPPPIGMPQPRAEYVSPD